MKSFMSGKKLEKNYKSIINIIISYY